MLARLERTPIRIVVAALLAWLGAVTGIGCSSPKKTPGIEIHGPTSLVELFPQAEKKAMTGPLDLNEYIRVMTVAFPGRTDRAIYQHPPTRLIYHLKLLHPSVLETAVGLLPEAWDQKGDGVLFYIAVDSGSGQPDYLLLRHMGAELMEDLQGWQSISVDLTSYTERDIYLILGTDPGPNQDWSNDLAVWREPWITPAPTP